MTHVRSAPVHEVEQRSIEFVSLYMSVYSEAPYFETKDDAVAFGIRLAEERHRLGFAMRVAEDNSDLIGFAYGLTFAPGRWWKHADVEPEQIASLEKFAIMELVVRAEFRGRHLGTQLMRSLLSSRPEPLATLATNPLAQARDIYRHWGWRSVATSRRANFPDMDILLLPLSRRDDT